MDNLTGFLGIRRMDIGANARMKELCRVAKGVDARIDKCVLLLCYHIERMKAKRVYVGEEKG